MYKKDHEQKNRKKITKTELFRKIKATPARGRWAQAVKEDALKLVKLVFGEYGEKPQTAKAFEEYALNGAKDWKQYSWGGNALVYDYKIAEHYCTPSELKLTRNGDSKPNAREEWLDVQARALHQACALVKSCY